LDWSSYCRDTDVAAQPILNFGLVGKICPVLAKLEIDGCWPNKRDIFALIVKEDMAEILFPKDDRRWSEDEVLLGLRLPEQFLNPLCTTLKEVKIEALYTMYFGFFSRKVKLQSSYAFAIRHLSKLEHADLEDYPTIDLVELLYRIGEVNREGFNEAWREAASRLGLDVIEPPCFVSGNLNLFPSFLFHILTIYLVHNRLIIVEET